MAMDERRIDLDGSFVIRFIQDPALFLKNCREYNTDFFLNPYQYAYKKRLFSFGKSSRSYSARDFSFYRREGFWGEKLVIVFLPKPVEPAPGTYHMAYGISCTEQQGTPRDIKMHILKHNWKKAPSILRVEQFSQEHVVDTTDQPKHQIDMLWRAAFGNGVVPATDTAPVVNAFGQVSYKQTHLPYCEKIPEKNSGKGFYVDLNNTSWKQPEEINLSQFAATSNLFDNGLTPEEERRQKEQLARRHKCSPDEISLCPTIHGGVYSIARGGGGHYTYQEFDKNHKCIWAESISGHSGSEDPLPPIMD